MDDIILTDSSLALISELITKLNGKFALKKLGGLDYFLGIEVKRTASRALLLSQAKYICELLTKANLTDANLIATPLNSSNKLSRFGSDILLDSQLYRSIVGAIQYVTLTRLEIGYSVNKVCQFMAHPLECHWKAVKRIRRYLKGTLS